MRVKSTCRDFHVHGARVCQDLDMRGACRSWQVQLCASGGMQTTALSGQATAFASVRWSGVQHFLLLCGSL